MAASKPDLSPANLTNVMPKWPSFPYNAFDLPPKIPNSGECMKIRSKKYFVKRSLLLSDFECKVKKTQDFVKHLQNIYEMGNNMKHK
jgi:hypothetical protein